MSKHKWEVGPVKLVNGNDAEIFQINDRNNSMKYVGVRRVGLDWHPFAWDLYGIPSDSAFNEKKLSLAPPQKKKIRVHCFANVYADGDVFTYGARKFADESSRKDRFALIEIYREVEEGEGLDPSVRSDAANVRSENQ